MKTTILGYPRIGERRELKKALEAYWKHQISEEDLLNEGRMIRKQNWNLQKTCGIDLIPSNDFSFYDQVLDMTLMLGAFPARYYPLMDDKLKLYFAMARGYQIENQDIIAMEMTKWFDTNYHYMVPEFVKCQPFKLFDNKALREYKEAKEEGIQTKPVLLGPITYLLLGKEKESGFHRLELLNDLLPVYLELLKSLEEAGAEWVQIDEPFLALDTDRWIQKEYLRVYGHIKKHSKLKILLTTYFEGLSDVSLARMLPVDALHIDLVRAPQQLTQVLEKYPKDKCLSLGVVDGRNIWKNDFEKSLALIAQASRQIESDRLFISGSCSFLHVPYDLELETNDNQLLPEIKQWMAFAKQKVNELTALKDLSGEHPSETAQAMLISNKESWTLRRTSKLVYKADVQLREKSMSSKEAHRQSPFAVRRTIQRDLLRLPFLPTTTIGSFPQTADVRLWRAKYRKGELSEAEYTELLRGETKRVIEWQEKIGLDVLVHGEFERTDMVEYFGEKLEGFAFSQNGWVQSYGSRCVKPPIIYGDVYRNSPMTVEWSVYAQSLTNKFMKGMLTGPVTILEWSFVRDDQPQKQTCRQIALAIRDEVCDLEAAGIRVIQIDEPAIREGLPLLRENQKEYLDWAVECFGISAGGVKDSTQIHTHMCYCEFNDVLDHIVKMDADVITIECSRSQMELLDTFGEFKYPNEIGPGVYDIHSPRVPSVEEMVHLLQKAAKVIPAERLWVNPDCGLKTRAWPETEESLKRMIEAAQILRRECQ